MCKVYRNFGQLPSVSVSRELYSVEIDYSFEKSRKLFQKILLQWNKVFWMRTQGNKKSLEILTICTSFIITEYIAILIKLNCHITFLYNFFTNITCLEKSSLGDYYYKLFRKGLLLAKTDRYQSKLHIIS